MFRRPTSKNNSARKRGNSLNNHDKSVQWNKVLKDIKNVKDKLVQLSTRQFKENKVLTTYNTPRAQKTERFTSFSAYKGQSCFCTCRKSCKKEQLAQYYEDTTSNRSPYSKVNRFKQYETYNTMLSSAKMDMISKQVRQLEQKNQSLLKQKKYLENKLFIQEKQKRQLQQLLFNDNITQKNDQLMFSNKIIFNNQNLKREKRLMYAQNRNKDNYPKIRYVPIDSSIINNDTKQTNHNYTQTINNQEYQSYQLKTKNFGDITSQQKDYMQTPVINEFAEFDHIKLQDNNQYKSKQSNKSSQQNSIEQIVQEFDIEEKNSNNTNTSTQKFMFGTQRLTKLTQAQTEKYILGCKKVKSPINSSNTTIFNMEGFSSIFHNDHQDEQSSRNLPFNLKDLDQQQSKSRFSPRITFSRDGDLKGFSGMMKTPKNQKDSNKTPPMTKKKLQTCSQNRSLQLSVQIKGIKQTAERQKFKMMQKYFQRLVGFSREEKDSDKKQVIRQQMSEVAKQMSILRDKLEQSDSYSRACEGFVAIQQQQQNK